MTSILEDVSTTTLEFDDGKHSDGKPAD